MSVARGETQMMVVQNCVKDLMERLKIGVKQLPLLKISKLLSLSSDLMELSPQLEQSN